jgi:hypothetical protein
MTLEDIPTPQGFLLLKSQTFSHILNSFLENDDLHLANFLINIDIWDWEMECLMESFSTLSLTPLVAGVERIVPILKKGDPRNLLEQRRNLIKQWNELVAAAAELYSLLDFEQKEALDLLVEIDFELYLKS